MPPEVFPRRMRADGEGLHSLEYSMNVCGEAGGGQGVGGKEEGKEGTGCFICLFKGKSHL